MSAASNTSASIEIPEPSPAGPFPAGEGASAIVLTKGGCCYHCGEPCPDSATAKGEKVFCCQGCRFVHELLSQNGLEHFYELGQHPGIRVQPAGNRARWACLDGSTVQQRLLDFTDGRFSRVTLHLPAIHCVACVWLLENLFRLHPAIGRSRVNFARRELSVGYAAQEIALSELVALLSSLGYEPELTLGELEPRNHSSARRRQWLQIGIAGFAFGNIMLFSLPAYLGMDAFSEPVFRRLFGYLSLLLALPSLVFSAADYWKSAWISLRRRALSLDVPIALGLAALYFQSAFEILARHGQGYLDSLTGLIFFLLCGRAFQQKTYERLAFDRDYKSFFPLSVLRLTATGETSVALSELRVGDRIRLRNGELIPADARLVHGSGLIDYSFVTGESEAVPRAEGDYLYAGGRQTGAAIEVETVKPVSQSYLTSLWNHESFRKAREDTFDTITNRYSRYFTVVVAGIALVAALGWWISGDAARAVKAFASVLIVACPCALALATPFTFGTAQRLLGRIGMFFRNASVVERLAQVSVIVFDKTGTLTAPHLSEATFQGVPLGSEERTWVCSLSRHSAHPHSVGLYEALRTRHSLPPAEFVEETPGAGIAGQVQNHQILLGSRQWLAARGVRFGAESGDAGSAGSVIAMSIDGVFRGVFVLENALRPAVAELLKRLGKTYELALLSGDNERERARFREFFGHDSRIQFNQSPLDKLEFVRRLQDAGKKVMMVGDGLNDAGALNQSDVGVAVVEKVGAFSPASDVILEAGQLERLGEILTLARQARRAVWVSLGLSAVYNLIGVSVAAAGVLSPLFCAILMPLSSVSVVAFACAATSRAFHRTGLGRYLGSQSRSGVNSSELQPAYQP